MAKRKTLSPGLKAVYARIREMHPREVRYYKRHPSNILAHRLGISRQATAQWQWVPDERIREVARITGLPEHVVSE